MKRKFRALSLVLVSILTLLAAYGAAHAESRSYTVEKYSIGVDIRPDGSAVVEERLTYRFDGSFNGILRNVDHTGTGGIENVQVLVVKDGAESEFKVNSTTDLDDGGAPGTYNLVEENGIAKFKIFEKSANEDKTFVIRYTFLDVVTRYSDIAEFNRIMVDPGWDVPLSDITIDIRLPEGANKDEIRIYGHGPLTGVSRIIDERNVQFSIDYLPPGNKIETLVLFPTALVPQSSKFVEKAALPEILEREKRFAEEANAEREQARRQVEEYRKAQEEKERRLAAEEARKAMLRPYGYVLVFVLALAWLAVLIYIYIKYDRELKHNFEGRYYRELPGEYTPAEMSVLVNMGGVETRDITATLMDLARKKQLVLKTETYIKEGIFRDKEVEDYSFSLNPDAPAVSLKKHESFLVDWFIGKIGDGESVFLDKISSYAKTSSGARRFVEDYKKWKKLVAEEADKNGFFDKSCGKGRVIGILSSIAFAAAGLLVPAVFVATPGYLLIVLALIMAVFSARIKRRTSYGNEQHAMWMAFRNFLKDFSRLDRAELPSLVIWEHYLVYAVSLGVAKEVIRQLPLVFNEADLQDASLTYMYGFHIHNFAAFTDTFDRTINSVDYAISHAVAVANSVNSSASGHGGGFSGGSSGGGGGGGGGAF